MSQQNLTQQEDLSPGFYGKLPSLGDFVSRRLPQDFIQPWDTWLQNSILTSKELLGEQWLNSYLTSPIWRFAFSSGICGKESWAGIIMPSIDRVGRYFPLTIASKISENTNLTAFKSEADSWYKELEAVALSALENDLSVEQFDDKVRSISRLTSTAINKTQIHQMDSRSEGEHAFYLESTESNMTSDQINSALSSLLLETYLPNYSIWSTTGSEEMDSAVLVVRGMPPITAYVGMISDQFLQSGWVLHQQKISQNLKLEQTIENENNISALDLIVNNTESNMAGSDEKPLSANIICSSPEQRILTKFWRSFSRTDAGNVRNYNEDSILDRPDLGLWVVADGMGGHQAGDQASQQIIRKLNEVMLPNSLDSAILQIRQALQDVNNDLKQLSAQLYNEQIVGSTVVVLITNQTHFACLWAGDSRLYRLRNQKLIQLSIDHCSEQEDLTDILKLGSSNKYKQNNVITRAVGAFDELELDCQIGEVQSGDIFLLSSDGLDKEMSFQEIENVLIDNTYNDSVEILLEQVLSKGARDNVSVIAVEIQLSNNISSEESTTSI